MSNVYDERGTVVATHPVVATQHDGDTNNAPERLSEQELETLYRHGKEHIAEGTELGRAYAAFVQVMDDAGVNSNDSVRKSDLETMHCTLSKGNKVELFGDEVILSKHAMQPQVSESDEAVAGEIYQRAEALCLAGLGGDDGTIAAILARHRQPAHEAGEVEALRSAGVSSAIERLEWISKEGKQSIGSADCIVLLRHIAKLESLARATNTKQGG